MTRKKNTCEFISLDKWFRQLQRMAEDQYCFEVSEENAGQWQEFYDDGYSPREALDEDTYAGV